MKRHVIADEDNTDTAELPVHTTAEPGTPGASSLVKVDLGAASHPGKVRANNEDHYLVARADRIMRALLTNVPEGYVQALNTETVYGMVVADGMGGMAAGEVASRTAISEFVDLVLHTPDWIMRFDERSVTEVLARMASRFNDLKTTLMERAKSDPSLTGMGTTMTLVCSLGANSIICHVGDSRAYLFREGQLARLTRDHTLVQSLAEVGAIRQEDVATHPMRHLLTNAIDTQAGNVKVELHQLRLMDGDQILVCSDGLTDMVTDAAIADKLRAPGFAADICNALVDLALDGGGKDNVTVVLARYRIPGEFES
ncbi:MAG TPA: protein phosphatase 2C domain-containing protein [Blastocatellia bacterium]|nr:protein phosphatase 2C domain-containing protein [Blastocatellia bacterium]